MAGPEMAVEILDATGVVDVAVLGRPLRVRGAVFGDQHGDAVVVVVDALEQAGQAGRLDQPVHVGDRPVRGAVGDTLAARLVGRGGRFRAGRHRTPPGGGDFEDV